MIHNRTVTALVPIKNHSERVKGKNFRDFCGRPLYHHIIESLHRTYAVDKIVIDTDSARVTDEAPTLSRKVHILDRPASLRGDTVSTNKILAHDIRLHPSGIYLQTHATNPLLRPETIARALRTFVENEQEYDSLFSVNVFYSRFYGPDHKPVNHDPDDLIPTQNLPPMYEENSCLYVFTKRSFEAARARIGRKALLYTTPPLESADIDDEMSWKLAETLGFHTLARAA